MMRAVEAPRRFPGCTSTPWESMDSGTSLLLAGIVNHSPRGTALKIEAPASHSTRAVCRAANRERASLRDASGLDHAARQAVR